MTMELLTRTRPEVLREFAQLLHRRALGAVQEITELNNLVNAMDEDDWSGISRQSFLRLWHPFHNTFREVMFVITRAAPVIERLADELALAQDLYHKGRLAALDAGFSLDAEGLVQMSAGGAAPAQAIDLRMFSNTINDALAEAQAADQRAARELEGVEEGAFARYDGFVALYNEKIVPLHTEVSGALVVAADGLERRANQPGLPAVERARAAQAASRYRALANNPVFRIGTKTVKGVPILTAATAPLDYAQNVAEGDDRGEAATKAVVSTGTGLVAGAAAAAGAAAVIAAAPVTVPALAAGAIALGVGAAAGWAGSQIGTYVGPTVHDKVVTPFLEQSRETIGELGEHAKNFPDDLRDTVNQIPEDIVNFPEDLRREFTGR